METSLLMLKTKLDDSLLEKLKITLFKLDNAFHGDAGVKELLGTLRYAIFEVENLLDEINTEALRCKVESEYQTLTPTTSQCWGNGKQDHHHNTG
ncbi:hypothetical protein TSUD_118810 [Trifolium subterraneum]|uniref:Rx N-terminal domain-containing protein n=1 Tax=Trifolium subterraneum TaxID=3900 RepID=A0A2Z6M773_TRISU|nr:hypothetical protein TSUD_118810 [Trifolium subterraneum]